MSRIDDLIREKCPDGVELRSIGSMITRVREKGKNSKDVTQVYVVSNTMGIVRSEDFHNNEVHSEDTSNYTVIKYGMFAYNPSRLNIGSLGLLEKKETGLVSPMYVVFSIDEKVITKEYLLLNLKSSIVKNRIDSLKEEGARFRFDFTRWDKIEIPVPPIEVQQEIVRVLDKFTELEAELQAELDARKCQFSYVADKLLSLENSKAPQVSIKEICKDVCSGKNKERLEMGKYPVYGSTGIIASTNTAVYSKKQILIARVGANAGYVHIADGEYDVSDNALIADVKDGISLMYIYYQMRYMNLRKYAKGGGQPLITAGQIKNLSIPLPSIYEQERIVAILQKFDEICNGVDLGIPAEIEARHKQYEYYRDKLLTFERKVV